MTARRSDGRGQPRQNRHLLVFGYVVLLLVVLGLLTVVGAAIL